MSTMTEPPRDSFRLSQLIYDTRYRSLTIQVIASILIALGLAWLVSNTITNLENLGKNIGFGFLSSQAGYDINQKLVDYDSLATHGRAAFVGILNTLLIAVLGCVTATILGVVAGVLRLSKNWLISKLMTIYVEGFRNVPLLLWIILIFSFITEQFPQPRDFRGDSPVAEMVLNDTVAITNRGVNIPSLTFENSLGDVSILGNVEWPRAQVFTFNLQNRVTELVGLNLGDFNVNLALLTLLVAIFCGFAIKAFFVPTLSKIGLRLYILGVFGAFLVPVLFWYFAQGAFGSQTVTASQITLSWNYLLLIAVLVLAFWVSGVVKRRADRIQGLTGQRPVTWHIRLALILVPFIATLFFLGVGLEYPELKGFNFSGGMFLRNTLIALWLALSLYTGAFIAEIVRSGILAVSKGQSEAAFALGMRPNWTMNLVILPQALRVIVPPLISQYLNLTKNSSLAIAVGYMDVRSTLGGITINQTGRELEGMLLLGLFYLALSLLISGVMNLYNDSVKLQER